MTAEQNGRQVADETTTQQDNMTPADTADQAQEAAAAEPVEGDIVEPDTAADAPTSATEADLRARLEQAEREASEYKDKWLRAMADYKNFKRRWEQERAELTRSAGASLVLKLLPIVDDFERAADNVPPEVAESPWWSGAKMVTQKLTTLLHSEGVTPIAAVGEEFDPNLHDAVVYEEAEGQDGKVTAELQKGYRMHDRVLRPAMVKVGKG